MQTGPSNANDLLNFFKMAPSATSEEENRMEEINQLLNYNKDLEKTEEKNNRNNRVTFLSIGGGLLALSIALLAKIIPGVGDLEVLSFLGYGLVGFAAIFSLSRLQNNPLAKLKEKMEQLHTSLLLPSRKPKTKGIFKSKKDRIIGGVAAGLARRFGVQPGLLRLLLLALIPITSGSILLVYLILALGLRFVPEDQEN